MPATGKSTLMKRLMLAFGASAPERVNLLRFTRFDGPQAIVLGLYPEGQPGGTDRLSVAVTPEAIEVLRVWSGGPTMDRWTVLFEGDRLFSVRFLEAVEDIRCAFPWWVVLEAEDWNLSVRHEARKDSHAEKRQRVRRAKLLRIRQAVEVEECDHNDEAESEALAGRIAGAVAGFAGGGELCPR